MRLNQLLSLKTKVPVEVAELLIVMVRPPELGATVTAQAQTEDTAA